MEIKFDTETIRLITLFENLTGAPVKDCIVDNLTNTVYLIIEEGKVGIAIGKNGNKIKKVEELVGKNIKVFEFSENLETFVKNIIPQVTSIKTKNENGKKIVEISVDKKDRPIVIGRDGKNLKIYKEILQRSYGIDDLIIR